MFDVCRALLEWQRAKAPVCVNITFVGLPHSDCIVVLTDITCPEHRLLGHMRIERFDINVRRAHA